MLNQAQFDLHGCARVSNLAGELSEIRLFRDQVVDAFRKGPDFRSGALIGFTL